MPTAYQRVAAKLRERILDGTYPPGTGMPSLREVEEEFGVSRYISRTAYGVLVNEGRVEGRKAEGYFVRSYAPIVRDGIQRLTREGQDTDRSIWQADPGTASRKLVVDDVVVTTEEPPSDVAVDLGLDVSERTVVRRSRYSIDGKPVLLSSRYYPARLATGTQIEQEDTGPGGVYARLADLGEPPAVYREDVIARMPSPDEQARLALPAGTPVLGIRRVVWGTGGRALEVNAMTGDASAYVLRYQWSSGAPE